MEFTFSHVCFYVLNIDRSMKFYSEALGLSETRRFSPPDGAFTIVFLGDGSTAYSLELTEIRGRQEPYDLGENETHLALSVPDIESARAKHRDMGCICFENNDLGIYFIEDPDGYWIEIIPERR